MKRLFAAVAIASSVIVLVVLVSLWLPFVVVAVTMVALALAALLATIPRIALAYDDQRVHPWLTRQAIDLLGRYKLAAYAELVYVGGHVSSLPRLGGDNPLVHGSIVEDTPATNGEFHFMNPGRQVHDTVGPWSGLSSGVTFGKIKSCWPGSSNNHPSALDRATDSNVGSDGDAIHHTLGDAVALYERGEMLLAYEVLGRLCHLLEDMSVPAHVRNDNHLGQYIAGFAVENKVAFVRSQLPEGWGWDFLFPPATAEALKKGMEPFELVTYDLVLQNRAPATTDEPEMKDQFGEFYRQLALHTHDNWYSENTIPGNDTYPGADVSEAVPDLNRCTLIDQPKPEPVGVVDGLMNVVKAGTNPLGFTYYEAITPKRFENILNAGDARNPTSVKRPYTLSLENHMACARDVMPKAIRYAAGLVEFFYEEREHLKAELKSVWVPAPGQQVSLPAKEFETPPRGEHSPAVNPGQEVYICFEIANLGAMREDLEIRLDGLDEIIWAQGGQVGWKTELLLAEEHFGAAVAATGQRDVWKVVYPKNADLKWQEYIKDQSFGDPKLKLALRITPPGQG